MKYNLESQPMGVTWHDIFYRHLKTHKIIHFILGLLFLLPNVMPTNQYNKIKENN